MKLRLIYVSSLITMAFMLPGLQALGAESVTSIDELIDADRAAAFELAGRGCGTPEVSPAEAGAAQARVRDLRSRFGAVGPAGGTIDVAFHNIMNGVEGYVSRRTFAEQIQVMNERFAGSGFTFRLRSIDRVNRQTWFTMLPGSNAEKKAKKELAIDPAHTLNVYTCSPGEGLLGWAYFPFTPKLSEDSFYHGVVIHYGSLPDGFIPNYNLGLTLVHETGHYLGLFHTFQGGCVAPGDYIDDTPFEASPAFGCPIGRNTCLEPGNDPIHNYMDYTYDDCYTEFTPLQYAWMQTIVPAYRPSLLHHGEDELAAAKPAAGASMAATTAGALEFRGVLPNPFAREATIRYSLPSRQHVSLSVYNVAGQRVTSLVDGEEDAGEHLVIFAPRGVAAGMYFVMLRSGGQRLSRSAVFIP